MSRARPSALLRSPILLPFAIAVFAPALWLVGCSDEDSLEAPSVENFARHWNVTSDEYLHASNGAITVDLVAEGWTIDLYVNDNGRLRFVWTPPGGEESFWDANWSVAGGSVIVTRDGSPFSWEFAARVGEESMTLRGADAEYDFDANGTPEPAIWNMAGSTD